MFGFFAMSNNSGVSGTLAEQLCVDVTGNDDDVSFTFYNNYNLQPEDRFLTLAVTDGGDGVGNDWAVFAEPLLELATAGAP